MQYVSKACCIMTRVHDLLAKELSCGDLRMRRYESHEVTLPEKEQVTFSDVINCRIIYDVDRGIKYDRFTDDGEGVSVDIKGKRMRKAFLLDSIIALFVFSPRTFESDLVLDEWLLGVALGRGAPPSATPPSDLHWLAPPSPVSPKVVQRICDSWLTLNDARDVAFHVWTTCNCLEEIAEELRVEAFESRVTFHFKEELILEVQRFHDARNMVVDEGFLQDVKGCEENPHRRQLAQDLVIGILLANKGGIYADLATTFCARPMRVLMGGLAGPCVLAYDGLEKMGHHGRYFLAHDGREEGLGDTVAGMCRMWPSVVAHIDEDYISKAIRDLSVTLVRELVDVLVRSRDNKEAHALDEIQDTIGCLKSRLLAALPGDGLAERILYEGTYFSIEQVIVNVCMRGVETLGFFDRYDDLFAAILVAMRIRERMSDVIQSEIARHEATLVPDMLRLADHLERSSLADLKIDVRHRINAMMNIGRCLARDFQEHRALTNCLLDPTERFVEVKFDSIVFHYEGDLEGMSFL